MNKIFLFVLAVTALDFCSTRPYNRQRYKGYTGSSCVKSPGRIVPTFKMIKLYDNVTLTCPFNGKNIIFLKKCIPIKQSVTNNKIRISGNTLTLTKFVTMDNGKYSCQEKSPNGQIKEFTWVLHISFKPVTPVSPIYKERPVNSAVVMDCQNFKGKRLFHSYSKGGPLTEVFNRLKVQNNLRELYDLQIHDTGFYYCGTDSTKKDLLLHLEVRDLPKVKGTSIAKVGDFINFECSYRGPQNITWYKDNKPISGLQVQQKKHGKKVLKLHLINVSSDSSGDYACVATFDNYVSVNQTIKFEVFAFTESVGLYGGYTTPNATAWVQCMTNINSLKVKYSLFRNPFLVDPDAKYRKVNAVSGSRIYQLVPGLFAIKKLNAADEGYYKCSAAYKGLTIETRSFDNPIWLSSS